MPRFFSSQKARKTYSRELKKALLVVFPSLHEKQLLMKVLFGNQQIYAKLLLGLILTNLTPTQGSNLIRPAFLRVGISIQKRVDSDLVTTNSVAFKAKANPKEQGQFGKMEDLYTTGRHKEIDCCSVDGFFSHCKTAFEALSCFYHSGAVNFYTLLSLKRLSNGSRTKRELGKLR